MLKKMNEIISFNSEFKNAINLYLNLNKTNKVKSYIPTKSSVNILERYLGAVEDNKFQSTLLIGPYGKGKSHLLLVLLAVLSMERNKENTKLIHELCERVKKIDEYTADRINSIWNNKGKFLPVIIMSTQGDLNQAFLVGLSEALKREGLEEITPDTYFSHAIDTINRWKIEYGDTFVEYVNILKEVGISDKDMLAGLTNYEKDKLDIFKQVYPRLTAGSKFNPLAGTEVLPMYSSLAEKLKEEYGYSGIYIVFDEFSKFIEGQEKKSTGNNMKLVQDMCELASESKDSQVFITMVAHKSIKEYGHNLSNEIINSFTGIEGRLEEIRFETSSKNNYELIQNAIFKDDKDLENVPQKEKYFAPEVVGDYYDIAAFKSAFTLNDFEKIVVRGCYPLSPISAYILLSISEKVAQNERTLFTFISKDEPYSMAKYVNEHPSTNGTEWVISANLIYDYFKNLFKKDINNEFIHNEWLNAEYAISQVNEYNQIKMLKALASIIIVNKPDELPADEKHLKMAAGMAIGDVDGTITLQELIAKKVIYKKGSTNCYAFKTRAGSELKKEIKRRRELKGENINIGKVLSLISDVNYILPKQYNQKYSMTRYFRIEFMNVDEFLKIENADIFFDNEKFCDGKVFALFSTTQGNKEKEISNKLKKFKNSKLVVIYSKKQFDLLKQVQDYEVIQELKKDNNFFKDNEVLLKELPIFEEDIEKEIECYINEEFFGSRQSEVSYFINGEVQSKNGLGIGKVIDSICLNYYDKTMIVNNELINKEFVTSSAIKKARKIIIDSLLSREDEELFFSGTSRTSAEATIYRALLVNTGIISGDYIDNAENIMSIFDGFLLTCGKEKKQVSELVEKLKEAPVSMRNGLIPVYLAYAISKRNEDIVIYYNRREVPMSTDTILNMCQNPMEYSIYISMEDIIKEKYVRDLIEIFGVDSAKNLTDLRINNILICMQRWYRSLPQITKNIQSTNSYFESEVLSKSMNKIKKLFQSMEVNPYEAIFVVLPEAFECEGDLGKCAQFLKIMKQELNNYFDWMLSRTVKRTTEVFDRKAKEDLNHTLLNWYEKQSNIAKKGLHNAQITGLMSCIAEMKSYDEIAIVKKIVKVISEVYIDSWNDSSLEEYVEKLTQVKKEVESINDIESKGKLELKFSGKNGEEMIRYYDRVDESIGAQLRDVLEDTMEDFSELSVNDKVAILLETIENIVG